MAEERGFDEARVANIGGDYEGSELSVRDKIVLRYADCFLAVPASSDEALRSDMRAHFSDAEIVELTAALALFMGFSKIAIALGPVPEGIPVMQMPLPDLPDVSTGGGATDRSTR